MKAAKLSLAVILSTTAIAGGVLFSSVDPAQSYPCSRYRNSYTTQTIDWWRSPWVAVLTIPGIALGVTLYRRGRSYQN
ncbi:hypothetical protein [Chroococcidiopsis sp.]|uniref:hypothetical protein n=1 Tax=Chroococcidiopsis sp. TaxID=3088168 RepID=UPI003F304648